MTRLALPTSILASILLLAVATSLGACGSEENDTLTLEQANEAFGSTSSALISVDGTAVDASQSGSEISASASCTGGGSAAVSGTFTDEQSFTLSVDFEGCSQDGLTMDGNLDYGAVVTDNGVAIVMDGTLSYSGNFEATCRFDIRLAINLDGVEVDGSVCGQEITASVTGR